MTYTSEWPKPEFTKTPECFTPIIVGTYCYCEGEAHGCCYCCFYSFEQSILPELLLAEVDEAAKLFYMNNFA